MALTTKSIVDCSSRRLLVKKCTTILRNACRYVFEQQANSIFTLLPWTRARGVYYNWLTSQKQDSLSRLVARSTGVQSGARIPGGTRNFSSFLKVEIDCWAITVPCSHGTVVIFRCIAAGA